MKLIIRDVSEEHWLKAMAAAKRFIQEYPDRMGFHQLVIYGASYTAPSFAVYRTKTAIIVRGV